MLIDTLKQRVVQAMKAGDHQSRDVLKVVLGDLQLTETRKGQALTDTETQQGLRKVIKGNREMIAAVTDPAVIERMEQEIAILETLLPQSLTPAQILGALAPVADAIRAAGNDGQATGVAMKHLKSQKAQAQGQDVAAVVRDLRTA
ncbi:MAG: GatB/YqeY domain-containing protein [Planctomycetota bacterium]